MADEFVQLIPARDQTTGTIQWTMVYDDHVGGKGSYPDIDLSNNGQTKFIYTIVDVNNLGITFDPRPVPNSQPQVANALWVSAGSGTQKTAGINSTQIAGTPVLQNGNKQLKFFDKNSNYDVLTYQLNFINSNNLSENVTSIDPEIRNNGGGGITQKLIQNFEFVIAAAVLLAIVTFFVGRALGRRSVAKTARPSTAGG
jgi:hypothetical protein